MCEEESGKLGGERPTPSEPKKTRDDVSPRRQLRGHAHRGGTRHRRPRGRQREPHALEPRTLPEQQDRRPRGRWDAEPATGALTRPWRECQGVKPLRKRGGFLYKSYFLRKFISIQLPKDSALSFLNEKLQHVLTQKSGWNHLSPKRK